MMKSAAWLRLTEFGVTSGGSSALTDSGRWRCRQAGVATGVGAEATVAGMAVVVGDVVAAEVATEVSAAVDVSLTDDGSDEPC